MPLPWFRATVLAALVLLGHGAPAQTPSPAPLTVYAAASLADALDEVGAAYTKATGRTVRYSYAASSSLARQIEAGAPADVYVSADEEWMDYLEQHRLIAAGTRHDLLGNRLVLIAAADNPVRLKIAPGFALAAALGDGRLATGDPDSVPVGRYARAALSNLGVWNTVENRLVRAENVRSALHFVALGEAPLGIVYDTDARVEPRVRVVDVFPGATHPAIRYPVAITASAGAGAAQYVAFLGSATARAIYARYGFAVL